MKRMHARNKAERGRLITISVAALFAMLVMGAASADVPAVQSALLSTVFGGRSRPYARGVTPGV